MRDFVTNLATNKGRFLKWAILVGAATLFTMASSPADAFGRYKVEFDGSFSEVTSSDPACDGIFEKTDYHAQFHLVGPTRRTLVTHFRHANEEGIFHARNFVSLFGYQGDFLISEEIVLEEEDYLVKAEGFVDQNVVYIEWLVTRNDIECEATATYSGFN